MNAREAGFFGPTHRKLLFLLALLVATFWIPKTDSICSPGPSGAVCHSITVQGIGYPLFLGERFFGDAVVNGFFLDTFAINLFWAYILACFFDFVWTRRPMSTTG